MVVLNFTIPHLRPLILSGQKQHTIRRNSPYWNRVLKDGTILNLYFNQRTPRKEHLFDVPFLLKQEMDLRDIAESVAIADGFKTLSHCQSWLVKTYPNEWRLGFLLISWDYETRVKKEEMR